MKLIIITAIKAYETSIKAILKNVQIGSYTYKDVTGFKDDSAEFISSNWFGTEMNEQESILFFAFVAETSVAAALEAVNQFNQSQVTLSKVHVVVLNIEQSN
jgi:hypothetical protein